MSVLSFKDPREAEGRPNAIVMHPDFRMLVLANRPGFPFLGNDFFGALGTVHTHTYCMWQSQKSDESLER